MVCDIKSKPCMYRECLVCKDKTIKTSNVDGQQVSWYMWKNVQVEYEKKTGSVGKKQFTNRVIKEKESGTMQTLVNELLKDLERISRHIFNIQHQYKVFRGLIENLDEKSAVVHIDFSENYACKYDREIQSMHFGASQRQISIHTGMVYMKNRKIPFSTFSDDLKHSPPAIWAHLEPVLKRLRTDHNIDTIHFISDGPTTQYRCKSNFYLLSQEIFKQGFTFATWNFLEAGHGKGAPDGIGAVIKRHADHVVNTSQADIMDAQDLLDNLEKQGTSVKLWLIESDNITAYETQLNCNIKRVPDTMKLHQILVPNKYRIVSRVVSCFCGKECVCFQPVETCFSPPIEIDNGQSTDLQSHVQQLFVPCDQTASRRNEEGSDVNNDLSDSVVEMESGSNTVPQSLKEGLSSIPCDKPISKDRPDVNSGSKDSTQQDLFPIEDVDETLISKFCVVVYDGLPYPGLILDVDDDNDMEVKVMARIGPNRFFWPLLEDRCWYTKQKVVAILNTEPTRVTARHHQIDPVIWELIRAQLDLDERGKKAL